MLGSTAARSRAAGLAEDRCTAAAVAHGPVAWTLRVLGGGT